ncbi:putative dehydrogenase [Paenibacillus taihuensis]|uniref:Putative dehydrogenase n=1 Tax=Paenibacillus taihuensis TaxID=1156355 RepID=A0A3D9RZE3_9BACL|nr:Gfo/Idh/MocA family oxidoreductase [Paenibacillus taihuensis]REE85302.1 putative dehydrogenase [Paenibacillus taihuensis]
MKMKMKMNKEQVTVGLISFAHGHAYSYAKAISGRSDVVIAGFWDDHAERSRGVEEQLGMRGFDSLQALLAEDIDAVIVCSENAKHASFTRAAAAAGKHVLCEKPLGLSISEMEGMIRVCEDNGVQLMTAFPCRYIPAVEEAKKAIDRGDIGEILAIRGTNRGTMPGGWFVDPALSGGGAVLDHTVHVMDLMNWFVQSEVKDVYAEAGTLFHPELEVEDAGMVHVRFANGVVASLDPSWSRPRSFPTWGDVTMEIIGTDGIISIDAFNQKSEVYADPATKAQWFYWGDDMDAGLLDAFITAIRSGAAVPITGTDGLKSAAVALAALESARKGTPIRLEGN